MDGSAAPARAPGPGGLAALGRAYRALVVGGRWFVLGAWLVTGVVLAVVLPPSHQGYSAFGDLLPATNPAVQTAQRSADLFSVPLLSSTSVVVHDPAGLTALTRADVALWALTHTQAYLEGEVPDRSGHLLAAIPVPTRGDEAAVTYLYATPGTSLTATTRLAREYAAHFSNQASVSTYVTGFTPAQVAQTGYVKARLPLFELASLVLIFVVVAVTFRSVVAPLAVLGIAGIGYVATDRLLGAVTDALGVSVPSQLQPVLLALLLGVVTDYSVLFMSTFREHLGTGTQRLEAAHLAVRTEAPVVAVAGLTVAGGTMALLAADLELFQAFGPAMAVTVLVGMAVSLTLVPAVMALLGRRLFPSRNRAGAPVPRPPSVVMRRLLPVVVDRRGAAAATVVSVGLLLLAALPLTGTRLDLSLTSGLPGGDDVVRGAEVLEEAGVSGATAPTEVLIEGEGVALQRDALVRLGDLVAAEPGVARVLGPEQNPVSDRYGVVLARDGDAARLITILDSDPLAAGAIADVRRLESRIDDLAGQAGLAGADLSLTGQTVIAGELARLTRESLGQVLLAALVIELVLLAAYLRALVAPLALLGCSLLGVGASLGVTTLLFQDVLGYEGLTFYVPFATAVLLLALGSDYTVFAVGGLWQEARHRPLAEAVLVAVPRSTRAITAAGVILAATFALVAIIPVASFRQIAVTLAVGLLLETFLIRPVLTPAVLVLLGRAASWPSHRITTSRPRPTGPDGAGPALLPTSGATR